MGGMTATCHFCGLETRTPNDRAADASVCVSRKVYRGADNFSLPDTFWLRAGAMAPSRVVTHANGNSELQRATTIEMSTSGEHLFMRWSFPWPWPTSGINDER